MPSDTAAQVGRLFRCEAFCLRAVQDTHGACWFKGVEVGKALGYASPSQAIRDHVRNDHRRKMQNLQLPRASDSLPLTKYEQEAVWITEPGVYELLLASRTELAERFRLWFVREVIPQLARTGSYTQQAAQVTPSDALQAVQYEAAVAQVETERERQTQLRLESKKLRLEMALLARKAAAELGIDVSQAQLDAERAAIDLAALPATRREDGYINAGDYLRMRGHGEAQVRSLQVTFGKMLKTAYERLHGALPPAHFHAEFGSEVRAPYSYDRQADRALLNGTYQLLTLTDTYTKQMEPAMRALNSVA
jgi:prophage antirepressor-like protein